MIGGMVQKKCSGIAIVVICMLYKQKRERKMKKKHTNIHLNIYTNRRERKKTNVMPFIGYYYILVDEQIDEPYDICCYNKLEICNEHILA